MASGAGGAPAGSPGRAAKIDTANPLDQIGDLDLALSDLARREETLLREYERNQRLIDDTEHEVSETIGTGEAEGGAVRVRADAAGHVTEVHLDPSALRLGSIGRLETAIRTACNAATVDATGRLGDALADPVGEFFASMPEVTALLGADSYAAYIEPALPASPPSPPPAPPPTRSQYE